MHSENTEVRLEGIASLLMHVRRSLIGSRNRAVGFAVESLLCRMYGYVVVLHTCGRITCACDNRLR